MAQKLICKEIQRHLNKQVSVSVFESVDSTNNLAKKLLLSNAETPFLIAANNQTGGRGRQGKTFFSAQNGGIYMTLAVSSPELDSTFITAAAAVAVAKTLRDYKNLPFEIKWVNDIYLFGKKVCGILCEAVREPVSNTLKGYVIGIGINTDIENFPDEIKSTAASVSLEKGEKKLIAAEIANRLFTILSDKCHSFLKEYKEWSYVLGKDIIFYEKGIPNAAFAVSVDENGGLVVKLKNNEQRTLQGGEISLALK